MAIPGDTPSSDDSVAATQGLANPCDSHNQPRQVAIGGVRSVTDERKAGEIRFLGTPIATWEMRLIGYCDMHTGILLDMRGTASQVIGYRDVATVGFASVSV